MKLHTKVLIGMAAGMLVGAAANYFPSPIGTKILGWMGVYGRVFIRLITMLVVPLVASSILVGIASIGDLRKLGKIGARTIWLFFLTTVIASAIGFATASIVNAGSLIDISASSGYAAETPAIDSTSTSPEAVVLNIIPANPLGSAASGDLFGVIFFMLVFGAALSSLPEARRAPIVNFFTSVNETCAVVVRWIMKLAPTAVFCLIAAVMAQFGLSMMKALSMFCLAVVLGLFLQAAIVFGIMIVLMAKRSPIWFYRNISSVALMAFSTSSSSATLPLSLQTSQEKLGVAPSIGAFVLSLGTTMNKNGSALYKAAAIAFIAQAAGVQLDWSLTARIILAATLSAMTTAGVPGSGLVAIVVVLQLAGLGALAPLGSVLVAGVDRILDMLRTTINVVGSLACAVVVAAKEVGGSADDLAPGDPRPARP